MLQERSEVGSQESGMQKASGTVCEAENKRQELWRL